MPSQKESNPKLIEKRKMLQEKYAYQPKRKPEPPKINDPKLQLLHDFKKNYEENYQPRDQDLAIGLFGRQMPAKAREIPRTMMQQALRIEETKKQLEKDQRRLDMQRLLEVMNN